MIYLIIGKVLELVNILYDFVSDKAKMSLKVIVDYMRVVVYFILDGVVFSNIGRGYVVRRLIRRVVCKGKFLGINGDGRGVFLLVVVEKVIEMSIYIDLDVKLKVSRIFEEIR